MPYLTVRTEGVRMVHENMAEIAGIFTQSLTIRKTECEYFLFDFIPRDLKSSAALQNYIGELGLPTSCIRIRSPLPRGGWEA